MRTLTADRESALSLSELEQKRDHLADLQSVDFRAANIIAWVAARIPPGGRVLDVGCGAGGLVAYLLEQGIDARGIDTSEATIGAARQHLESRGQDPSRISIGLTTELIEAGNLMDTVVCMDCLEHVEDDQSLFDELVALCRPGDTLIVTVPAMMRLYGERDVAIGHYRRYETDTLKALVRGAPLQIRELRFWNLLGVAPTYFSQKLLGRNIDEEFRFGKPSLSRRVLRRGLHTWFRYVENRIPGPFGMTLLLHATRQ